MDLLSKKMQKRFGRFLLFLLLKRDFYKHWKAQGTTWDKYVRLFLTDQYRRNTILRRTKQHSRIRNEHWEQVVLKTWLFNPMHPPPKYVCEDCEGENTLTTYNMVRYKSKQGELSLFRGLISTCSVCGTQKIRDGCYGTRELSPTFTKNDFTHGAKYLLAYVATYGDNYSHMRRQMRIRITHALLESRAGVLRPGDSLPSPLIISEENITDVCADGVILKKDGPLYAKLISEILKYEQKRMNTERCVPALKL